MLMSCWSLMYKLVDSKKCRLQTECKPLFSGLGNSGTISTLSVASWLSWLERHTGIARSWVQIPLKSWFFFSGFLRNCINCVQNCKDHSSFDFISTVLIYDLFHKCICQWDYCCHVPICMVKTMFCTESSLQSSFCTYVIYWDTHCAT